MNKTRLFIFTVALVSLGVFLIKGAPTGWLDKIPYFSQEKEKSDQEIKEKLTVKLGAPFELVNQQGALVRSEDLKGRYLLITFGYSSCPGICIMNMQAILAAIARLGKESERILPVFITFDPERDTPEVLAKYVKTYHNPRIIALTGNPEKLKQLADAYKVYTKVDAHKKGEDYMIDHSSLIYLMGPNGESLAVFPPNTDPQKMAEKITTYL